MIIYLAFGCAFAFVGSSAQAGGCGGMLDSDQGTLEIEPSGWPCLWVISLQNRTGFQLELSPSMKAPILVISEQQQNTSNSNLLKTFWIEASQNVSHTFPGRILAIVAPARYNKTTLNWTGLAPDHSRVSFSRNFVNDSNVTSEWEHTRDGTDQIFWAFDLKASGHLNWTLETELPACDKEDPCDSISFAVLQIMPDGNISEMHKTCEGPSDGSLNLSNRSQMLILLHIDSPAAARTKLQVSWGQSQGSDNLESGHFSHPRGSCSCHGHASRCLPLANVDMQPDMVHGRCECTHNTKGLHCETCKDFYWDWPWKPAIGKQTNACKICNCNNHATRCHFDEAVFEASGGVSGGVCDECEHNTVGHKCERCKAFFYLRPDRTISDIDACAPCDCDPRGTMDDGICDSRTEPDYSLEAGRCHCKPNVTGRRCGECKEGYWNLEENNPDGCQAAATTKPQTSRRHNEGSDNIQQGYFFYPGSGFMKLSNRFHTGLSLKITMSIKPKNPSGLILAVHGPKDYMILQMLNGAVKFTADNGRGPVSSTFTPSGTLDLCDGKWHKIEATKMKHVTMLKIDGHSANAGLGALKSQAVDTQHPFYLGGQPNPNAVGVETTEQFVGCIKDFVIEGRKPFKFPKYYESAEGRVPIQRCPVE